MNVFLIAFTLVVCYAAVYLLVLRGRVGHENIAPMKEFLYAHRGFHAKPEIPENSLAAFQRAVNAGYGAEFDVHLLADGGLAVIHDSALLRTTGKEGNVEDLTEGELTYYHLEGTSEKIPTFAQTLNVFGGKTPLIIELKTANGNAAALCEATCAALEGYEGLYCIESFDPRCIAWLRRNRPEIMRGQLSCNFLAERSALTVWQACVLTHLLWNCVTRPDFIAYHFEARANTSNVLCRDVWHLATANWTIRKQEDLDTALREGAMCIFEQFTPREMGEPVEA